MPNSQALSIELGVHSTDCFRLYVLVYLMPLVEPSHMTMYQQAVSTQLISIVNLAHKTLCATWKNSNVTEVFLNFNVNFFTLCFIKEAAYKMRD
jgi:hypothetical protein